MPARAVGGWPLVCTKSAPVSEAYIARLRAGDREAFDTLVREHHAAIYKLLNRLLHHADDAQEVTQEVFLAAYEGIAAYEGRAGLRTWLLAIAYRKGVDRLKRQRTERGLLQGELDDETLWTRVQSVERFTDWRTNPEQTVNYQQVSSALHQALAQLPADSRAVFELRDLQGLDTRETAEVLGLNEGAVRVRLHRVRQFLMTELEGVLGSGRGRKR